MLFPKWAGGERLSATSARRPVLVEPYTATKGSLFVDSLDFESPSKSTKRPTTSTAPGAFESLLLDLHGN